MSARWRVIHGGKFGQPVRRTVAGVGSYRIETNPWGVAYVYFAWSPTNNVFDCIMPLGEAVARGFVPAPRVRLTLAAGNVEPR